MVEGVKSLFSYAFDKNIILITSYLSISTKMASNLECKKNARARSTLEITKYANTSVT